MFRVLPREGVPGGPVQPFVRLCVRWVRRPLHIATKLYRRNIQLRVVATTLLMSLGVVVLLGIVVIGQVRNGLLEAKLGAAHGQAQSGFAQAEIRGASEEPGSGSEATAPVNSAEWRAALVEQLMGSGQGVVSVLVMSSSVNNEATGSSDNPRGSLVSDDTSVDSIPADLREKVDRGGGSGIYEQYARVWKRGSDESEPSLIIGKRLNDPNNNPYQLYFVFPFTQEEKTLSLVKGTLATAGVFVVVLLGAIAWLVVRQVVTPVRMAAGIAERLAAGRLQERMKVSGEDDIARLGQSFNKMAQNLQVKIQQLEELSRMQRRFVSDVSHELRTPLTTVRMAADVIHEARGDFDPVTSRSAELLLDQLDRFESLLSDLLEISRFDAGAAALDAEPVDLREIVRRVVGGAQMLADAKGGRLLVKGDERPVIAEVDARRVERVLRNLVVNAVEHGEGRDVVVRLGASESAVAVAVRDYGVGLKPGEATRVFNRFWRADPARARTTGGTGLGLSISLEDARLHGGWLQAWGEPGGGSQFRLTLPRTGGEPLHGSPVPLEPEDSRARRAARKVQEPGAVSVAKVGGSAGGELLGTVPAQGGRGTAAAARAAAPRPAARAEADPTALPGSGRRVSGYAGAADEVPGARSEDGPENGSEGVPEGGAGGGEVPSEVGGEGERGGRV
ncbi:MtrAB system histidine kinase MtrB [Streptomyces sp. NBC_01808]|uniref:MtrAB system histidine kinase MtrB n=1 Tax=Streptomyces sp. NBC_01808 TaxID=2975947 RepID=UPI002DDA7C3D|nr:MtrAB system histidine kinase MtrB [Streptomyces sp. NBC_01808]WSA38136.1 MtrAB system histidine kinase MtrB [Streptomyces sp. NBC_01808]